ncbi:MAG: hypothetical protein OXU45_01625, partial [Candidatus Melainabacteria bacterium]|nr:hypothetical protein [Candidatus Melainabacteria bacterium]
VESAQKDANSLDGQALPAEELKLLAQARDHIATVADEIAMLRLQEAEIRQQRKADEQARSAEARAIREAKEAEAQKQAEAAKEAARIEREAADARRREEQRESQVELSALPARTRRRKKKKKTNSSSAKTELDETELMIRRLQDSGHISSVLPVSAIAAQVPHRVQVKALSRKQQRLLNVELMAMLKRDADLVKVLRDGYMQSERLPESIDTQVITKSIRTLERGLKDNETRLKEVKEILEAQKALYQELAKTLPGSDLAVDTAELAGLADNYKAVILRNIPGLVAEDRVADINEDLQDTNMLLSHAQSFVYDDQVTALHPYYHQALDLFKSSMQYPNKSDLPNELREHIDRGQDCGAFSFAQMRPCLEHRIEGYCSLLSEIGFDKDFTATRQGQALQSYLNLNLEFDELKLKYIDDITDQAPLTITEQRELYETMEELQDKMTGFALDDLPETMVGLLKDHVRVPMLNLVTPRHIGQSQDFALISQMLPHYMRLLYEVLGGFGSHFAEAISMDRTELAASDLIHDISGQDEVLEQITFLSKNLKGALESLLKHTGEQNMIPDSDRGQAFVKMVEAKLRSLEAQISLIELMRQDASEEKLAQGREFSRQRIQAEEEYAEAVYSPWVPGVFHLCKPILPVFHLCYDEPTDVVSEEQS